MANFDSEFFDLVFFRVSGHQKNSRPKFTSRIVGIPLQFHFLEPKIYSRRFSAYGGDQQFLKKRSENAGANENLLCAFPRNSGNRSESCSENCGFRIAQVARHHSENGISRSENYFCELRELLREYPGTLPELREWPFCSESVFPEIGVVPRLLKCEIPIKDRAVLNQEWLRQTTLREENTA